MIKIKIQRQQTHKISNLKAISTLGIDNFVPSNLIFALSSSTVCKISKNASEKSISQRKLKPDDRIRNTYKDELTSYLKRLRKEEEILKLPLVERLQIDSLSRLKNLKVVLNKPSELSKEDKLTDIIVNSLKEKFPETPNLLRREWDITFGSGAFGRGDLVLSNKERNKLCVAEVKYLYPNPKCIATTEEIINNRKDEVKKQAVKYGSAWCFLFPGVDVRVVSIAGSYYNYSLLSDCCLKYDGTNLLYKNGTEYDIVTMSFIEKRSFIGVKLVS